jgi:hypothetical protein
MVTEDGIDIGTEQGLELITENSDKEVSTPLSSYGIGFGS